MKCPKCDGTGQIAGDFLIPLWNGKEKTNKVSFVSLDAAGDTVQARKMGREFAKFIKAEANGCFHDGLKSELNR